ncbi:hypothetical protein [Streptomyces sp. NBC_01408]|nr:hypothetical protein [Streptomyces sp. NBC_01408]MCX4693646.1 hypothetical protein [Streptomyces sp. NBC_01408]
MTRPCPASLRARMPTTDAVAGSGVDAARSHPTRAQPPATAAW